MTKDKSIDMFILLLNVVAIMVLVGILSVMVNKTEAGDSSKSADRAQASVVTARE